jgi:monothiol glutaredoxin
MNEELKNRLNELVNSNEVMIFMKGNPEMPMCRFSSHCISMLNDIKRPYGHFNILNDEDVRQGLKEFSNWPTFPQVYFKGQLIGGDDIITEMFESGELQSLVNS